MTEIAEHLLHPRPAADQLRAILEGGEHADGGEIAALARELLAEHDEAMRSAVRALHAAAGHIAGVEAERDQYARRRWQWAESVSWHAPGTVTVPISLPAGNGDVDADLVLDAAQASVLAEMLADAAKGGER